MRDQSCGLLHRHRQVFPSTKIEREIYKNVRLTVYNSERVYKVVEGEPANFDIDPIQKCLFAS